MKPKTLDDLKIEKCYGDCIEYSTPTCNYNKAIEDVRAMLVERVKELDEIIEHYVYQIHKEPYRYAKKELLRIAGKGKI